MNWKAIVIVIVCVILLAIPTSMMVASGEFFPDNQEPYRVAIILPSTDVHGIYISESLVGAQAAKSEADESSKLRDIDIDLYIFDETTEEGKNNDYNDFKSVVGTYNLVYGPSFNNLNELAELSNMFPGTRFLSIDNTIVGGNENNTANISFNSEEVSFITGYVAGMFSKTNKVGFLGGIKSEALDYFYYGFISGVKLAEIQKGEKITVYCEYIGSFIDKEEGYAITEKMYNDGADVVFTVAGDAGLGGIQAAVDKKQYVIGVDVDQNIEAPNNVLFSATKNISQKTKDVIFDLSTGISYTGDISFGFKDNALDVVSFLSVVPAEYIEDSERLKQAISDGKITIPKNEEEYNSWNPYTAQAALKII